MLGLGWRHIIKWSLLLGLPLAVVRSEVSTLDSIIYTSLDSQPCSRLLTAQGSIGCTSSRYGDTGVLYGINSQEQLDQFQTDAPDDKFTIVMSMILMTKDNINKLKNSGKLASILVISDGKLPSSFSADDTCPNCEYSILNGTNPLPNWNPAGTSLYRESYNFPIFVIPPSKKDTIKELNKAIRHNLDGEYKYYPLYAVELSSFMWSAGAAEKCLSRDWCSPIVLAAATNGRSFFNELSGDDIENNLSGLVGVLAVAEAFSRLPNATFTNNILFTLFNGESWGFAGSQRFVKDISTKFECSSTSLSDVGHCPLIKADCASPCRQSTAFTEISIDRIQAVVELNQIGHSNTKEKSRFFVHTDDQSSDTNPNGRLPPTSAQSFLQSRKIPAIVISDFDTEFSPDFDNSFNENVGRSVCDIARVTANGLYQLANGNNNIAVPKELSINCDLINSLFDCFINNSLAAYSDFFQSDLTTQFLRLYMANLTSTLRGGDCKASKDCKDTQLCIHNQCVTSYTNLHEAYVDASKPTWVESSWDPTSLRIFKRTSNTSQIVELVVGIICTLVAIGVTFLGRRFVGKKLKVA
ncbi:Nicastrin-domain-containing protein [Syncephalis fuscata]|nr:Nicastrin-domain-containing protein [Syncephalis fuscata]